MKQIRPDAHRFYIDIPLLLCVLVLMAVSLVVLYSAGGTHTMFNQAIRFGIGLAVMVMVAFVPPSVIRFLSPFFYVVSIILLIAVYFFGVSVNGSQRWLSLGVTKMQPSELAKLSVPLMLAYYYSMRKLSPKWRDIIVSLFIIFIPVQLVYKQPDLGTAILIALSGLILLFLAGITWRLITVAMLLLMVCLPIFWHYGMKDYQKERVMIALNPESDPTDKGYNIIQSKIAIGSGGFSGKGYGRGVQSAEYLPERTTDFIFAVFSEEFGLRGTVILLILYLLLLLRGLWLAVRMGDNFSRLLSGTLVMAFFCHCFINIAMVLGMLPVVGLPLPLLSYGGTSILSVMLAFGLMMSLYSSHQHRSEKTQDMIL